MCIKIWSIKLLKAHCLSDYIVVYIQHEKKLLGPIHLNV